MAADMQSASKLVHKQQAGCTACIERDEEVNDTCDKGNVAVHLDAKRMYITLPSNCCQGTCHEMLSHAAGMEHAARALPADHT